MEKAAIKLAAEQDLRLSAQRPISHAARIRRQKRPNPSPFIPTGMYGPVVLPDQMNENPHVWLRSLINGGEGRHQKMPNDSHSMIHLHDLAALFMAAYENPSASGRYFGVYESWPWQDIYAELQKLLPDMKMPEPFSVPPVPPTGFDFTRRASLGVSIRDIPTTLRQTIDWIQSDPFKEN